MTETKPTVVYIYGSGHCGSTLLNLLLNGHSQMIGLSEIDRIGVFLRNENNQPERNPLQKPFWQQVQANYEQMTGESFLDIDLHRIRQTAFAMSETEQLRWEKQNHALFASIAAVAKVTMVVDSSKGITRLLLLRRLGYKNHLKVIHLVRDGRGVINSYIRRHGSFKVGYRAWVRPSVYAFVVRFLFGKNWQRVRYERLASDPITVLSEICEFLSITYEPAMLNYRDHLYIGIGGNRVGRMDTTGIQLDEKWRTTLSRKHKFMFTLWGGLLNKLYGY